LRSRSSDASPAAATADADARADADVAPLQRERRPERVDHAPRHERGLRVAAYPAEEHGELVAAEARDRVGAARGVEQAPRHQRQQVVAGGVAQRVVDVLEVVEVDEQHGRRLPRLGARQGAVDAGPQPRPVGEPGERVLERLPRQLGLERPADGDVGDDADRPDDVAGPVPERHPAGLGPDLRAVPPHERELVALRLAAQAVRHAGAERGPLVLRHEHLDPDAPDQLVGRVARDVDGAGVRVQDPMLTVGDQQPVVHALHDRAEPPLRLGERLRVAPEVPVRGGGGDGAAAEQLGPVRGDGGLRARDPEVEHELERVDALGLEVRVPAGVHAGVVQRGEDEVLRDDRQDARPQGPPVLVDDHRRGRGEVEEVHLRQPAHLEDVQGAERLEREPGGRPGREAAGPARREHREAAGGERHDGAGDAPRVVHGREHEGEHAVRGDERRHPAVAAPADVGERLVVGAAGGRRRVDGACGGACGGWDRRRAGLRRVPPAGTRVRRRAGPAGVTRARRGHVRGEDRTRGREARRSDVSGTGGGGTGW
jgi:hypothetical protein